jgi:hypothetical protein
MEVICKLIEDLQEMKEKRLPHYQIALVPRENNQRLTANQEKLEDAQITFYQLLVKLKRPTVKSSHFALPVDLVPTALLELKLPFFKCTKKKLKMRNSNSQRLTKPSTSQNFQNVPD